MPSFVRRTWVELRGGFSAGGAILRVPALRLGDWAAHRHVGQDTWGLTLLPLGLCLPQDWASFADARSAVRAMEQIVRLRNSWAHTTQADLTPVLAEQLREITRRSGALLDAPVGVSWDADVPLRCTPINGYNRKVFA